jgi:DHA1 family multidrug resistance protein-like MFS transporter
MLNFFKQNEKLVILCVQTMIMMMGMGLISPILPLYAQNFGANAFMVGFLITAYGIARVLVDIPIGNLAGKLGRRPILLAGPVILAIGSIACGLAANYGQLLIFRFLQGFGSAAFTTSAMIMAIEISTPTNRAQVLSLYQGSLLVGSSLGPTLGGIIAEYFGMRTPFFVYALFCLVSFTWAFFRLPEVKSMLPLKLLPDDSYNPSQLDNLKTGLKTLLYNFNFILISIVTLGVFFTRMGALNQLLPLFANNRLRLNPGQIGTAMTIISVVNLMILLFVGKLSDRFGRKVLITPGCITLAAAVILLSQASSYWALLAICVIWGIGSGIAGPIPSAYAADIIPRENYSSGMGLFRAAGDLGFVTGPVLLGWFTDMRGFGFSLLINAAFLFLATLAFQIFAKEPKKQLAI